MSTTPSTARETASSPQGVPTPATPSAASAATERATGSGSRVFTHAVDSARGAGEGHSSAPLRRESPRVTTLAHALAAHGQDEEARGRELAAFWAEVEASGTPLVEPLPEEPEHCAVTFLLRGGQDTEEVLLLTNRLIDRSDYSTGLMERLPDTDVWHFTYRLRADHHGSYRIGVQSGKNGEQADDSEEARQKRLGRLAAASVRDPLNPRTIATRWSDSPSSVFSLPQAPPQPYTARRESVARGTVEKHRVPSQALGDERDVWVYLPPRPWPAELDLLVLLDGDMWFGQLPSADLFDNLHADGAVRPLAVIAPDAVDNRTRMAEFGGRRPYADFLTEELIPWASERLPLASDPARTTLAGQSLGGITALYVGLVQRGERVGNVIGQSSSLWWHPDVGFGIPASMGEGEQWLTREYAGAPPRAGLRLRVDIGVHEGAMARMNRDFHQRVSELGYDSVHTEYNGGHDYVCWIGALADGLTALHAP